MSVSIIMPVKNAGPFLKECLDSILDQTYKEWELIAVDDHSEDDSRQVLNSYSNADSRISVSPNSGQGIIPALQKALENTTGRYITRMDADDLMPPDRLEKMIKAIQNTEKTIVTGLVKYFSDKPVSEGYQQYEEWLNQTNLSGKQWQSIYRECVIASPNWMISRKDLVDIGNFSELAYPEDYHQVLKWYQHQFRIKVIPEVTLLWREHPGRTSRNSDHYNQEAFFQLKLREFVKADLRTENLVVWGNNVKTRLTKGVLDKNGIAFHEMDLNNFKSIEKLTNPQVLIGVYPSKQERLEIGAYLSGLGLELGRDYWYL